MFQMRLCYFIYHIRKQSRLKLCMPCTPKQIVRSNLKVNGAWWMNQYLLSGPALSSGTRNGSSSMQAGSFVTHSDTDKIVRRCTSK